MSVRMAETRPYINFRFFLFVMVDFKKQPSRIELECQARTHAEAQRRPDNRQMAAYEEALGLLNFVVDWKVVQQYVDHPHNYIRY